VRDDVPWKPDRKGRRDKGYANPKENANDVEVFRDWDADPDQDEGASRHDCNDKGPYFSRDASGTHRGRIREEEP
jgi:hypothetical protein